MTYLWNPTASDRSILGQIRQQQSRGQYNVLFGGKFFTGWTTFPVWPGVMYKGQPTHAAGAFQFEPATDTEASHATGITDFSPSSQDIKALWLLRNYSQASQWGTNFTNDGAYYGFPADMVPAAMTTQQILTTVAAIRASQLADEITLAEILAQLSKVPASGTFSPPPAFVATKLIEVSMSVMEVYVGPPGRSGSLTFSEPDAPLDGAVHSSDPTIATISLAVPANATQGPTDWTVTGVAPGVATMSYTGTSRAPDAGPAQVTPMVVTVVAAPVEETGEFNPPSGPPTV